MDKIHLHCVNLVMHINNLCDDVLDFILDFLTIYDMVGLGRAHVVPVSRMRRDLQIKRSLGYKKITAARACTPCEYILLMMRAPKNTVRLQMRVFPDTAIKYLGASYADIMKLVPAHVDKDDREQIVFRSYDIHDVVAAAWKRGRIKLPRLYLEYLESIDQKPAKCYRRIE